MVAHGGEPMNLPAETHSGFTERPFKRFGRARRCEQRPAIIAAINDVVDCAGKLDSKSTGHVRQQSRRRETTPEPRYPNLRVIAVPGAFDV